MRTATAANLDEALQLYEKGVYLAKHGKGLLEQAEHKIEHLRGSIGGDHDGGPQVRN